MAEEEVAVVAPVEVTEEKETKISPPPGTTDLKRKLDDLEPQEEDKEADDSAVKSSPKPPGDLPEEESKLNGNDDVQSSLPDAKKPRLEEHESDGSALENGHEVQKSDVPAEDNAGITTDANVEAETGLDASVGTENTQITPAADVDAADVNHVAVENPQVENVENQSSEIPQEVDAPKSSEETLKPEDVQHPPGEEDLQHPVPEPQPISRKMEVPNNKVGVLIGKAGDTIRYLQINSGAKIQITRDAEADPSSSTRPVELIGTLENINKAERLIKDVIAEADAGGSPSLVARGYGTVQATGAAEQIQIQVPNEKVGLIIGKGGDTIKSLQTKSGARIQLIPQHLPEGDQSKERTVRVTGDKRQIEVAKEMIKEVMKQPVRSSPLSGGYNQQAYRPRGPSGSSHWGARGPPGGHATGYDNQQRGMYPSQNPQYMPQGYGGYPPQQGAPRSNFNGGWEQRPGHMHTAPPQGGGYDYYAHGGHVADSSAPTPMSNSGPVPSSAHGAPPAHANYNNYGQPQGPDYGQPTYQQPAHSQQNYGHGYDDPKYANQVSAQGYGGHGNAQQSAYPQQVATQSGYGQQPYSKPPTYGMPGQGPAPQSYGPPRAGQPGDVPYQNPSYGQNAPSQQPYPYASGGQMQQPYPYNSAPPTNEGYNQPQAHSAPAPVYPQPGGQAVAGYGQPGGQAAPAYPQGGQPGGYGPYSGQPGYGEQPVPNNAGYGYQGPEAGYATAATAYGAPANAQPNYVQPTANQPTYEQQPAPQSGSYASAPGSAPGFVKNLSPQPVYGQYDATQMYAGQH